MNTSDCPPLSTIRRVARRQGLRACKSSSGSHLWWLVDGDDRLASPRRGVTRAELWTLLMLPEADERAQAVWKAKPKAETLPDSWWGPE